MKDVEQDFSLIAGGCMRAHYSGEQSGRFPKLNTVSDIPTLTILRIEATALKRVSKSQHGTMSAVQLILGAITGPSYT